MKKIFGLALALSFIAACAAPPANNVAVTNVNSAVETAPPAITEADAFAKEKAVWEAVRAKDYESFANLLAADQIEVLDDGVHDKAASVEGVKQFEPSEVTFSDWKFLSIDKEAFIVAYTVALKGKFQGKEFPPTSVRGSSAWVYRDKKWVAVFHQECEAKPAPAVNTPAKPAASPTETPVTAMAGPDAIENEKAVWNLFKSRNYDAFASLLAVDFLEAEPYGFYDKAASLKAVSMIDLSNAVLSDFRTGRISNDATLVTYLIKGPGFARDGERSSTIWAKRDGKWLALFHHGGTVAREPTAAPSPSPSASPAKTAASPATSPATK